MAYAQKKGSPCPPKNLNPPLDSVRFAHPDGEPSDVAGGGLFYIVFMGKDPAFLFYPGDWLGGTITFSLAQKGAYMDLLMAQFNSGHLSENDIKQVLGADHENLWEGRLKAKFGTDVNGLYFNQRLDLEIQKRGSFVASRRKNLSTHMATHMATHMENRDRDRDVSKDIGRDDVIKDVNKHQDVDSFTRFWGLYPKRVGKGEARRAWRKLKVDDPLMAKIEKAIEAQKTSEQWAREGGQFIPHPATWLNQERWEDDAKTEPLDFASQIDAIKRRAEQRRKEEPISSAS